MSSGKKKDRRQDEMYSMGKHELAKPESTELQKKWETDQLNFLEWDSKKGKDVRDAPGMDKWIQLAELSNQRAGQERMGTGAFALADKSAGGVAKGLQSLREKENERDIGTGLESALAARRAEASGSVLPLAQLNQQSRNSRLGFIGNMYSANNNTSQPWWQQALGMGVSAGISKI